MLRCRKEGLKRAFSGARWWSKNGNNPCVIGINRQKSPAVIAYYIVLSLASSNTSSTSNGFFSRHISPSFFSTMGKSRQQLPRKSLLSIEFQYTTTFCYFLNPAWTEICEKSTIKRTRRKEECLTNETINLEALYLFNINFVATPALFSFLALDWGRSFRSLGPICILYSQRICKGNELNHDIEKQIESNVQGYYHYFFSSTL